MLPTDSMNLSEMRKILSDGDIQLTKSLGQNFLHDQNQLQKIVASAELKSSDNVLEIGTGSGYMAALMSKLCARVLSLEIDPVLARQARENLQRAGITNVEVKETDAAAHRFAACAGAAPYDAIMLSGSVAEVPADLLELLKTGGRLWTVVGHEPVMRATIVRRVGPATFHTEQPWDTVAPRLQNVPEPSRFQF